MWSGGWQQWPLQQANYQNVPHDQVDWAALAKQWIQLQRGAGEGQQHGPQLPAGPRPPGPHPSSASHHLHGSVGIEPPGAPGVAPPPLPPLPTPLPPPPPSRNAPSRATSAEGQNSDPGFWGWDAANDWKETYDYGHVHGNQPPLQAHSYDYNHGSDQYAYNQQGFCPEPTPYGHYWAPGLPPPPGSGHLPPAGHNLTPSGTGALEGAAAMPPFLRKEKKLLSAGAEHLLLVDDDLSAQMGLDAAKRKSLPAWIREGLEKMERDKLRQQERERLREEYQTRKAAKAAAAVPRLEDAADQTGKTPEEVDAALLAKSKFDSDSDGEQEERPEGVISEEVNGQKGEGPLQRTVAAAPLVSQDATETAPPGEFLSEEEKREAMMLKVRRMLTELLLEVTNQEILSLCKEVHMRLASKAPARQLASSTALSSIAGVLGGLSAYGSGANSSGDSEADSSSSDREGEKEEDSDVELERQIREKRQSFLEREREIEAMLDAEAQKEKLRHIQESTVKEEPASGEANRQVLPETEETKEAPPPSANGTFNSQVKIEKDESDKNESPKPTSQGSNNSGSFSDASSVSSSSNSSARSRSRKKYKKSDASKRSLKEGKRGKGRNEGRKRSDDRKKHKSRSRSNDKSTRYSRSRSRERRRDRSRSSERWRHRSHERRKGSRRQKGFHSRDAHHRSRSKDRYPRAQSSTDKRKKCVRSPSPLTVRAKKKKKEERRSVSGSPKRGRKKNRSSSSESERSGRRTRESRNCGPPHSILYTCTVYFLFYFTSFFQILCKINLV